MGLGCEGPLYDYHCREGHGDRNSCHELRATHDIMPVLEVCGNPSESGTFVCTAWHHASARDCRGPNEVGHECVHCMTPCQC